MNKLLPTLAAVMLLTGCAGSNDQIVPDCCYQGSITAARLSDLPMKLDEGGSVPVSQALDGFRPMPGFGGSRYPVREVDLRLVIESDMAPIFNSYDANRSTHVEQPELTVLYLIEAARGLGCRSRSWAMPPPSRPSTPAPRTSWVWCSSCATTTSA